VVLTPLARPGGQRAALRPFIRALEGLTPPHPEPLGYRICILKSIEAKRKIPMLKDPKIVRRTFVEGSFSESSRATD
jgi:hypothetical protein